MPSFNFNPADASSGFQVFPKDSYEVILGEPKTFYAVGKEGKDDNYGIRYVSKIGEGKYAGKKIVITCYQHSQGSRDFSKMYQMAALGFMPGKQDDKFDAAHSKDDWGFNTDTQTVGDGWYQLKGQTIILDLSVKMGEGEKEQQNTDGVRPLGS